MRKAEKCKQTELVFHNGWGFLTKKGPKTRFTQKVVFSVPKYKIIIKRL